VIPVSAMLMGILAGSPVKDASGTTVLWLVVGASDSSPTGISRAAKGLATKSSGALVFQTADCGEKRNVFGVALELSDSADAAKVALQRVRNTVKGAYIKRCTVTPRSLLSLRFPAVDSSIANVPDDAVNWEDSDRISTAVGLADGRDLVARRVFIDDPEDALEGRRVIVILAIGQGKGKVLTDDCGWPERFKEHDGQIAFQCAGAEAGDQLLHTVLVFDADGSQVAKVEQCRNPTLPGGATVICSEESVNANGRLKLRPTRVPLTPAKAPAQPPKP
jgi:hypothetical protein